MTSAEAKSRDAARRLWLQRRTAAAGAKRSLWMFDLACSRWLDLVRTTPSQWIGPTYTRAPIQARLEILSKLLTSANEPELKSQAGDCISRCKIKKSWRTRHDSNV